MFKTLSHANAFLDHVLFSVARCIVRTASGTTILYHIDKHGPGCPKPLRNHYQGSEYFRPWKREFPEKAIWLTPKWELVAGYQIKSNPVHVFEVDNGLIEEAGGIHRYCQASEIVIPGDLWDRGIKEKKIVYKGQVSESKQDLRKKEQRLVYNYNDNKVDELTDRLAYFILKMHGTKWGDFIKNEIQKMHSSKKKEKLEQLLDELERGVEPTIVTEEKLKQKELQFFRF